MIFVELNRSFSPVKDLDEPELEHKWMWTGFGVRSLTWTELRTYWRVVLLAEASCGKTAEFQHQADSLLSEGCAAFYVRIEELADEGFTAALAPEKSNLFEQWYHGMDEGWFFLDSVDEARLNHKRFDSALRRLARELGESASRAHIFISCRVSDWKGNEDVDFIQRTLSFKQSPLPVEPETDAEHLLLDPIFNSQTSEASHSDDETASKLRQLTLVQLDILSNEQCRRLARMAGVDDIDSFMDGIVRVGLNDFAERPGDLLELADYWNSHRRFASRVKMVEHSIEKKLGEQDPFRPDNSVLPLGKAHEGAERIAAALTFGKKLTLRAPGQGHDPQRTAGALNPVEVLTEWTDAERTALLRRGIFAPAAYGRIRFHHRSTQEYLTASWLERLLQANCPLREVWHCLFVEQYGVETVVPSLRPAVAWLALWQPLICNEIIRREPMILLQHGDPGSLPLTVRALLLEACASKHAAAEIADTRMDRKAMRLFADQALADAIRSAWLVNPHRDFQWELLGFIKEASIKACADLARKVASDISANDYNRMIAVDALKACGDQEGLAELAYQIMQTPSAWSVRLTYRFATVLYPEHLSVQDLLVLISESKDIEQSESYHYQLLDLYTACPDIASRAYFISALTDLCLSPPFVADYQRISQRYYKLATHLEPIARAEIQSLGEKEPSIYLIRLLMAVEWAERSYSLPRQGEGSLSALIQEKWHLHRALFWADVEATSASLPSTMRPVWHWRVYVRGGPLWKLGSSDLPWLYDDISCHCDHEKRRIALQAAVSILDTIGKLNDAMSHLQRLVGDDAILTADLDGITKPSTKNVQALRQSERENRIYAQQSEKRQEQAKASWLRLRNELQANPEQLRGPLDLSLMPLMNLTKWLSGRVDVPYHSAPLSWQLLKQGFGSATVAEAYHDGMKAIWRITEPERPQKNPQGQITTKWVMILSFGGIALEAAEDHNWALRLTEEEAERAARHGFWAEQDYPKWIDELLASHSERVLPILKQAITEEWFSPPFYLQRLLQTYANAATPLLPAVEQILFDTISGEEPADINKLERGLRVLQRLSLDERQKRQLSQLGRERFSTHMAADNDNYALNYLALLVLLDTENSVEDLARWIGHAAPAQRKERAEQTIAMLFDRHDAFLHDALSKASVPLLEQLLYLIYEHIRPEDDNVHDGAYSPDTRDNAESARSSIFNLLLYRPGVEAFHAMLRLAEQVAHGERARRHRALARSKAENDAEPLAWSADEVVTFEWQHVTPIRTGKELHRLVLSVLDDIQFHLHQGDASSRALLERAQDEDEVQNWIAEQFHLRSRGRFHVYREAEVAGGNKPDLVVSSTSALGEVAIEIKNANKRWTVLQLEDALRQQLAGDYLKPPTRRHGILLISYHSQRIWHDPETKQTLSFDDVIRRLKVQASQLTTNTSGPIEVCCFGLNAMPIN